MRIAMTLLSGVGYGGLTYFQNLIPALAAADKENEYHLFVPQGHLLVGMVRQENIVFHECVRRNQSALKRFLWEQLILPRELKKYKVDILFTAKNLNVFLAPCKTVIALRNMEPLAYREYDNDWRLNVVLWLKWQLTKWSVRKADHIVAVSQAVKERLMEKFLGVEQKVSVVYNGNPVQGRPSTSSGTLRQAQGLKNISPERSPEGVVEGQPFLLSASKFVAYANQLNLLRGYVELLKHRPDTPPLWFAGGVHDKKYFERVQKFMEDNKLEEHVKFLGLVPHDRLLELMRSAQAFVFPSTLESCPHTLFEAMACGAPIVASRTPPMPEICEEAAVYFDPHDPDDVARAMERIMHDDVLCEQLRSKCPTRAQFFTWQKTARGLIDIFNHS